MEKSISDKMMNAFVDLNIQKDIEPDVPIDEQLHTLRTYLNTVSVQERITVAKIAALGGYLHLFKESKQGITINLTKLPEDILREMYKQLLYYRK